MSFTWHGRLQSTEQTLFLDASDKSGTLVQLQPELHGLGLSPVGHKKLLDMVSRSGDSMEIGISSLVFSLPGVRYAPRRDDVFQVFDRLAAAGFHTAEINTRCLPSEVATQGGATIRHYKRRISEHLASLDLAIPQIHISNNPGDLGSLDPGKRHQAIQWIKHTIEFCDAFRPAYVGVHPGGHHEDLSDQQIREAVMACIIEASKELAQFMGSRGVKLMLEIDRLDLPTHQRIIQALSEEEVGTLVDTGHCLCFLGLEPSAVIREVGDRLYSLHIHDNNGTRDDHLIPGEGIIRWGDVLGALEDVAYQGIFMMECCRSQKTADRDSIARLAKEASERLLANRP